MTATSGSRRDRAPIVLLHSLGTDSGLWHYQVGALERLGPVITLDSRGHGMSPWPGTATLDDWVADLHAQLSTIAPVHLVGLSMGGMQAIAYAATHPGFVRSLTIANAFAALPSDVAHARVDEATRAIEQHGIEAYADTYLAQTLTQNLPTSDYAILRDAIAGMDPDAYIASAQTTFHGDVTAQLSRVTCPSLMITGDQDRKTPLATLQRIAEGIGGDAPVVVIEDAGHLSCIENPIGFTRELAQFLPHLDAAALDEEVVH